MKELRRLTKRVDTISFHVVIQALYDHKIIPLDLSDSKDQDLLELLSRVAEKATTTASHDGIFRSRPNEVGNDMEAYVKNALHSLGLIGETPKTLEGRHQSMGYPDIYMEDCYNRPIYLEVKTYNKKNIRTTQRAFYLSPPTKSSAKVTVDAHHLVIAFEIVETRRDNKRCYQPVSWKIVSIRNMPMKLKHEFNSSNRAIYSEENILKEG